MSSGGFAVERSVGRLIEKMILVAAGGAAGAVCRYLVSLVPVKADFPVMTFVTNLAGAFLIGLIVGLAANRWSESPRLVLFLKTGFCGNRSAVGKRKAVYRGGICGGKCGGMFDRRGFGNGSCFPRRSCLNVQTYSGTRWKKCQIKH